MEFLKNHYEKIILAIFLVVFVFALIYAIRIIATVRETTPESLAIPKTEPDYSSIDFKADKFKMSLLLGSTGMIHPRKKISDRDVAFSQLNSPFPIARCPHCGMFVPHYYFLNRPHKCPLCTGDLPEPPPEPKGPVISGIDTDEDGIPDSIEKQFGLNPNDANDANKDLDGDGFPNAFEFAAKTEINNPKSHPPLCFRLYVYKIFRIPLGIKLKKLQERGDNRSEWDIQLDVGVGKKARTKFCKLNDVVKVGNTDYKIIDCNMKQEEKFDEKTKTTVTTDKSEVVIQSLNGEDKIVMVADQTVYSPKETVYLRDAVDKKYYRLGLDEVFSLGDDKTGIEKYKLIQVDSGQNIVQLKSEADNKIYEVSAKKRFESEEAGDESKEKSTTSSKRRRASR